MLGGEIDKTYASKLRDMIEMHIMKLTELPQQSPPPPPAPLVLLPIKAGETVVNIKPLE